MMEALLADGHLSSADVPAVTAAGRALLGGLGIDLASLERGRRPPCRRCLDWSERRAHFGARLLGWMTDERWVRLEAGRVLAFSPEGRSRFDGMFGPTPERT